jgi:hypothetical protein
MTHDNPILRQAALYGSGVLAEFGGPEITPMAADFVERIVSIVTSDGAREGEMESATDNAVSALVKFARFRSAEVDSDMIMNGVVAYLPIRGDGIEARNVHGQMIRGLATADPFWIGAGGGRVPAILLALAKGIRQHLINTDDDCDPDESLGETAQYGEDLFEEEGDGSLAELRSIVAGVVHSPQAAAVAQIIGGMDKHLQTVMTSYGFQIA